MAKSRQQKAASLKQFQDNLGGMKVAVFTAVDGITVKEITLLRKSLRTANVTFIGVKKTILKKALEAQKLDATPLAAFRGNVGVAFGVEDEVQPASILHAFAKTNKNLKFVAGLLNGSWMTAAQVTSLAKLPSKQELIAKLVWTIKAPLTNFANVLAGPMRGFIQVLKAKAEKAA
ncbi:MAG: 50S ribosomal protein L10 [Patescibacteria group bacterium]